MALDRKRKFLQGWRQTRSGGEKGVCRRKHGVVQAVNRGRNLYLKKMNVNIELNKKVSEAVPSNIFKELRDERQQYEKEGVYFDGNVVKKGKSRYHDKEGERGAHFVIDLSGDLGMYNAEGKQFARARKAK